MDEFSDGYEIYGVERPRRPVMTMSNLRILGLCLLSLLIGFAAGSG